MLNEARLISQLKADFPNYIGDDAAIIEFAGPKKYVVTKDLLVEDIHFRTSYFDPSSLAHRVLHANLSDLAAMGAKPKFILFGISIPVLLQNYAEEFLHCFTICCKKSGVVLIGGDTTKSPDKLFVSVTAMGTAREEKIKYRSTARADNLICVAGDIGHAHLGLMAFEKSLSGFENYKNAFLRPKAKVNEGLWLAAKSGVTSMMDISDGLFIDLERLCESSKLHGNIELDHLKPSPSFASCCSSMKLDAINTILCGGEDYALLFTVNAAKFPKLFEIFEKKFGYTIKQIGYLTPGTGVSFTMKGKPKNLTLKPFSHFGEL